MKRVFEIDVLICPHCGGPRKLIALLTDGLVARKILMRLDVLRPGDYRGYPRAETSLPARSHDHGCASP